MHQLKKRDQTPTEAERRAIRQMGYEGVDLTEFFNEYQFVDKMMIAKDRIVGLFVSETDPKTGRSYPGNYLPMVGDDIPRLAQYVLRHAPGVREIVRLGDISWYRWLKPVWGDAVLQSVRHELILQQLLQMEARSELWHDGRGAWEVPQSLVDEFAAHHHAARQYFERRESQPLRDERSFHGKPRNQAERRNAAHGLAPGGSISYGRTPRFAS